MVAWLNLSLQNVYFKCKAEMLIPFITLLYHARYYRSSHWILRDLIYLQGTVGEDGMEENKGK